MENYQTRQDILTQWDTASIARWRELIRNIPADSQVHMPHGHWRMAAAITGVNIDIRALGEAIRRANLDLGLTGQPWMYLTNNGIKPRVQDNNIIECHFAKEPFDSDAANSDFWRASTTAQLFLIRGYSEDSHKDYSPGTVFDLTYPIEKIGECLLFLHALATTVNAEESQLAVRCHWSGLQGRRLRGLFGSRSVYRKFGARIDVCTSTASVLVSAIPGALSNVVRKLVGPLYGQFGSFQPPADMYIEELARVQDRNR